MEKEFNIEDVINKFNQEGIKKSDIAAIYGISEKTLQRRIKEFGYKYDQKANKYIKVDDVAEVKEEKKKPLKAVGRPKAKSEGVQYVKRTYNIPKELDKKLKIAAIEEDTTTTELLIKILEKYLR